jgi:hypothetical protein
MKKELFLVLKGNDRAFEALTELKEQGFNATVLSSESLRKALDYYPGDHHFFNLRHLEERELQEGLVCVFVLDEDKLDTLKNIIREETKNFKEIKGFMYSRSIEDFEGSF